MRWRPGLELLIILDHEIPDYAFEGECKREDTFQGIPFNSPFVANPLLVVDKKGQVTLQSHQKSVIIILRAPKALGVI